MTLPMEPLRIEAFLSDHPGWAREAPALRRTWRFSSFRAAMDFVARVADVAEAHGHHPDIHVHYDEVTLRLWTHSTGTLTQRDLDLAASLHALA
jgi:4a-hydroxytetrahydrobiopterin dehydratase